MKDLEQIYRGRRVLVTGGLGFIGSNLAMSLVQLGAEVTVLDSLVDGLGGNLFNVEPLAREMGINISDMRDPHSLRVLVRNKDFIFHLAGQVSHGDSMRDPEQDLEVNCKSTMNLVEACRTENPDAVLLYTSTRQVYGIPRSLPVTEDHPALPVDVNGINKLAAEYYHLLYDTVYGLRSVILRLTNTYGPRQQIRNNRQGFIGILIRQALAGEKLKIFGTGRQIRDFNYVDDVVQAILLAGSTQECYGRIFNLGAQKSYSLLDFISLLHRVAPLDFELVPFPVDKKLIDIGDYYGDYSLFRGVTGWSPRVDLAEGLEQTVEFFKQHGDIYWR